MKYEINDRTGLPAIVAIRTLACGTTAVITFCEKYPIFPNDFYRTGPCSEEYFLCVGASVYKLNLNQLDDVRENVDLYTERELPEFLAELRNKRRS